MREEERVEHSDDTPMIRRRFLTPKVRRGQLATGEQVLAYVEKVNFFALCVLGVCAAIIAAIVGGQAQLYGVLCGVVVALLLSLISFFASRYQALGRMEGAVVQGGAYLVKIAVLVAAFFGVQYFFGETVSIKVAAIVVFCAIVMRLILSTFIIARTPVALDINPDDEE